MITFDKALETAKTIIPKVDSYEEYPDVYIFTNSKAEGDEKWDNNVVVTKKDGNVISYTDFIMDSKYADMDVVPKSI